MPRSAPHLPHSLSSAFLGIFHILNLSFSPPLRVSPSISAKMRFLTLFRPAGFSPGKSR